jgi:hypothetical protein
MNKFILAFILLFTTFASREGHSSGSNTVFLPVRYNQYIISDAIRDIPQNSKLQDYLESIEDDVYVARIHPSFYRYVAQYALSGYEVALEFEGYETVTFRYYSTVNAVLGFTSQGDLVILCAYSTTP